MSFKAYFSKYANVLHSGGPGSGHGVGMAVIAWHLGWSGCLLAALVWLLFLPASLFVVVAIVAMTLPGICALALLSRDTPLMRQGLVWTWSLFALIAVGLTGGVAGPLAAWVALPIIAAIVLNQRVLISLGATLSFMVGLCATVISISQAVRIPDMQESFWLSLISVFMLILGLSVALLPALRARVERAADAEEARTRLLKILTEQPQLVLCIDEAGRVVSAYGEAPPGLDLHQLMQNGLTAAVHVPDRPAVIAAVETAMTRGRAEVGFTPHAAMDFYLRLSIRRANDDRLYGVLSDGSLQHAREAALEAARSEAEMLNQGKTQFLASMSHELRTPLNAVIGFSDIMRLKLFGELPPKYAEYAQLIWESGQHVLDMINDVLDMSKIEAQRYELTVESFDIREPVSQALRLMRGAAHDKGIEIHSSMPAQAMTVSADKRAIKQISLNLLSNAVKFTPRGGDVRLSLDQVEDVVEITITDTGIGIAPDDLSRIGQPFEQAGAAEQKAMGTGLGLSIVKAMAHLHGGSMTLKSDLGEGTSVTVRLPVMTAVDIQPELPYDELRPDAQSAPSEPLERADSKPLVNYTTTIEGLSGFGDFVIRPPKS